MADFFFVRSLGRAVEYAERVNANDPVNCAFVIAVINTSETDAVLRDLDDMAAIESNANTAEVNNTGYARKVLDQAGGVTITYDDTNDRVDVDIPDQTWTAVAAGTAWTDLDLLFDSDTTAGTDSAIRPVSQHDFSVTPDGSDVTAQIPSGGLLRSS